MTRLLHGSDGSPFVRIVRILLQEKGLDFERNTTTMADRPVEEVADLNPALRVPILEDGERTLFESWIIAEYLLATYPESPPGAPDTPPAPAPPLAPALTRLEHHWEDAQVLRTIFTVLDALVVLFQMRLGGVEEDPVPFLRRSRLRVGKSLDWLDARASVKGFLPGLFSVQDLALVCALDFAERRDIVDWRGRSNLVALYNTLQGRPSVGATRAG